MKFKKIELIDKIIEIEKILNQNIILKPK